MNGELLELAQAMSAMETRLSDKIGTIATAVSGMNGSFSAEITSAKARIQDLEDENIREGWKDWLERGVFASALLAVHKGLTLLGFKI